MTSSSVKQVCAAPFDALQLTLRHVLPRFHPSLLCFGLLCDALRSNVLTKHCNSRSCTAMGHETEYSVLS